MVFKKIVGVIQIVFSVVLLFLSVYLGLLRTTLLAAVSEFITNIPPSVLRGSTLDTSVLGYSVIILAVFIGITGIMFLLQGIVNLLSESSSPVQPVPKVEMEEPLTELKEVVKKPKRIVHGGDLGNQY